MTADSRARAQGHAAQAIGKTRDDVAQARENIEQALASLRQDSNGNPDTYFRVAWHLAESLGQVEMTAQVLVNCWGALAPSDWDARLAELGRDSGADRRGMEPEALLESARRRLFALDRLMAALYDELRGMALSELGSGQSISDAELARVTAAWADSGR